MPSAWESDEANIRERVGGERKEGRANFCHIFANFCHFFATFCHIFANFCHFLLLSATSCLFLPFTHLWKFPAQEDKCRERRPRRPTAGEGKFWSICSRTLIPQMAPICFPYATASHFKVLLTLSATAIIWQLGKEKFLTAMKAIGTKCPAYPLQRFLTIGWGDDEINV